jgi:hypothetical protein
MVDRYLAASMTDRRSEIPKTFPLREQAIVVHQTARIREDFIMKKRGKGQMSDEDMNLQAYNVAVLDAAAATLKALAAEHKAGHPAIGALAKIVHQETPENQQVAPKVEEKPAAEPETSPPLYERPPAEDDGF